MEVDLVFINEGWIFVNRHFICWKEEFANDLMHSAGSWEQPLVVVKEK